MCRFPSFVWSIVFGTFIICAFFVLASSFTIFAATSDYIHFQSKLVNSDGTNVSNGNYNFKFEIYNVATGGTALWSEEQTINVKSGILDVNLGSQTAFPDNLFDNTDLYLQIYMDTDGNTTNGYEESFSTRMALTSVASSFIAKRLKGSAGSYTADDFLKKDSDNTWNNSGTSSYFNFLDNASNSLLYLDSVNSFVGINTSTQLSDINLHVNGNIGLSAFLQFTEQSANVNVPAASYGRVFAKDDGRLYYINSNGDVYDLTSGSGTSFWTDAGTYIYPNDVGEYVAGTGTGLNITDEGNIYMNGFLKLEGYIEGKGNGDLIIRNYGTASGYDLILTTDDNGDPTDNSSYGNIEVVASEDVTFKDKRNVEIPLTIDDTAWNSLFVTNNATAILDALNLLAQSAAGGSEWSVSGTNPTILHPSDTTRHLAIGGTDSTSPFYFNTDTATLYLNDDLSIGRGSGTDDDYLYFDAGNEYLMWDDSDNTFKFSTALYTGDLTVNDDITVNRSFLYTPNASSSLPTCDASNEGRTYYDSDTHNLYVCSYDSDTSTYVYVDLTAGADSTNYWSLNGSYLYPNQTTYSLVVGGSDSTAPFYFNVSDNNLYLAQDLYIGGSDGADDDSLYFDAGNERLYWDDSALQFVFTRSLRLDEGIFDIDALTSSPTAVAGRIYYNSTDGNLYFYDGADWKDLTAGAEGDQYWQDSTGVLNPKDSTYDFAIGGSDSTAPLFFDVSAHSLYIGNDDASADDFLRFDTGNRYLAWDDANSNDFGMTGEGLFELNGNLNLGGTLTTLYDLIVQGGDLRVNPQTEAGFSTCDSDHYGYIYYDSDDNNLYVCTSSGWEDLTAGSSGGSGYWSRDATGGYLYPSTITDSLMLGGNSAADADFYFQVGGAQNKIIADDDVDFDIIGIHGLYLRSYDDGGSGDVYTISGGDIHFQDANIRSANAGSYIDLTLTATGWSSSIPSGSRAIVDAINWLAGTGGGGLWYDSGTITYLGDSSTASTDDVAIGGTDSTAPFFFDNNGTSSSLTIQGDGSFLKIRELRSTDVENTDDGDGWGTASISTINLNAVDVFKLRALGSDMFLSADNGKIYFIDHDNYISNNGSVFYASAVFNDGGIDSDFRIESVSNANMLFVDAGQNRVGIGTNAPSTTLDLRGGLLVNEDAGDYDVRMESTGYPYMFFLDAGNNRVSVGSAPQAAMFTVAEDLYSRQIWMRAETGDKISLYDNRLGATNMYGLGIENSTMYFKTGGVYRWYVGANADGGVSSKVDLSSTVFDIKGVDLHTERGSIFNYGSGNYNFYIRSVNNSTMFVVDADTDRVGVGGNPVDTFSVTGNEYISQGLWFDDIGGDKIALYSTLGSADMYGLGIESGTLYFRSNNTYRWYIGQTADGGTSDKLELNASALNINVPLYTFNAAVFNEGSGDYDFRVESDGNTTMLFVDAGLNRVAIGDDSPVAELDVGGGTANNVDGTDDLVVRDDVDVNGALYVREGAIINYSQGSYDFQVKSDSYDYMLFLDASANSIGINNSAPSSSYVLDAIGRQRLGISAIGSSVPLLDLYTNEDTGSSSVYFMKMTLDADGTPDVKFSFSTDGEAKADGSWTGGGADIAEWFKSQQRIEPGLIVSLSNNGLVTTADKVAEDTVLGITSVRPGLVAAASLESDTSSLVALTGQVPLIVSNINGTIKTGDYVTSSIIPGIGQKINSFGTVIAESLMSAKDYNKSPEDCIIVQSLEDMHWDKSAYFDDVEQCYAIKVSDLGDDILITDIKNRYNLADEDIISFSRIMVFVDKHFYVADSVIENLSNNQNGIASNQVVTNYWTLTGDKLESLQGIVVPDITATNGTINILNARTLTVGDNKLVIDSDGNLSTEGDITAIALKVNEVKLQNILQIDDQGVKVGKKVAGKAILKAGETQIIIKDDYVTLDSIVSVTQNGSNIDEIVDYIVDVQQGQFVIKIKNPVDHDLRFSWIVVNNLEE